ncbi:MAG: hypothetical protein WCA56_20240 [Xanthobacteraceae bacterium]
MRVVIAFVLAILWFPSATWAQTPPPDAVARCRSITNTVAQFSCFHRLNEKLRQAAEESKAAPAAAATQAPIAPPGEAVPSCARVTNPQQRLSCYDTKWPPPIPPASTLPINN